MTFEVTRRDVMKFAGGAALGVALSPAPWRLLDDLAIWTQNGSWIPRVPRGPVTEHVTTCALCPAACPMKARCVSGVPVQLAAASNAPLCPLGLTGHHLAYHPARLTSPARIVSGDEGRFVIDSLPLPPALEDLVRTFSAVKSRGGRLAVLDTRPERSVSYAWRQLLASCPGGVYVPSPSREEASLATSMSGNVGIDFHSVRTVLSFGAPFAEGWGSPRNVRLLFEDGRKLIQVEPVRSATASVASLWIPVRPGDEARVANEIAFGVRRESGAFESGALAPHSTIQRAVEMLVAGAPSLAIAGVDPAGGRLDAQAEAAIAALNATLESAGLLGGLVSRRALPSPVEDAPLSAMCEIEQLPDKSVDLLVVDASAGDAAIAWPAVRRKLAANARVVALAPFLSGISRHADLVLPTPVFLESVGELPTPVDSPRARFALSAPLLPGREGSVDPASLVRMLAERTGVAISGEWKTSEELVRARVARIHEEARGRLVTPEGDAKAVSSLVSTEKLWGSLMSGSWWEDDSVEQAALTWKVADTHTFDDAKVSSSLTLVVRGPRDVASSAVASPVMTKLYQETKLRRGADVVVVHPDTAREQGVRNGAKATLATEGGRVRVKIETDRSVQPGVAIATLAPSALSLGLSREVGRELLDICPAQPDGSWRACPARLEV